jgi:hypothetical protein
MNNKTVITLLSLLLFAVVIFGVLITCGLYSGINDIIYAVNNGISSASRQLLNNESNLSGIVSDIKNNIEKEASIISGYTITYGKPDGGTLMGDITVTTLPKEYSENTSAQLFLNNESVNMVRDGNSFKCTHSVKITGTYTASITFSNGGINKTELLPETVDYPSLFQGNLQVSLGDITNNGSTVYTNISYLFYSKSEESAVSAKIVTYYNGQEKWSHTIMDPDSVEPQDYQAVTGDTSSGSEYDICVEVTDSLGFTYRYYFNARDVSETTEIYDHNGNKI